MICYFILLFTFPWCNGTGESDWSFSTHQKTSESPELKQNFQQVSQRHGVSKFYSYSNTMQGLEKLHEMLPHTFNCKESECLCHRHKRSITVQDIIEKLPKVYESGSARASLNPSTARSFANKSHIFEYKSNDREELEDSIEVSASEVTGSVLNNHYKDTGSLPREISTQKVPKSYSKNDGFDFLVKQLRTYGERRKIKPEVTSEDYLKNHKLFYSDIDIETNSKKSVSFGTVETTEASGVFQKSYPDSTMQGKHRIPGAVSGIIHPLEQRRYSNSGDRDDLKYLQMLKKAINDYGSYNNWRQTNFSINLNENGKLNYTMDSSYTPSLRSLDQPVPTSHSSRSTTTEAPRSTPVSEFPFPDPKRDKNQHHRETKMTRHRGRPRIIVPWLSSKQDAQRPSSYTLKEINQTSLFTTQLLHLPTSEPIDKDTEINITSTSTVFDSSSNTTEVPFSSEISNVNKTSVTQSILVNTTKQINPDTIENASARTEASTSVAVGKSPEIQPVTKQYDHDPVSPITTMIPLLSLKSNETEKVVQNVTESENILNTTERVHINTTETPTTGDSHLEYRFKNISSILGKVPVSPARLASQQPFKFNFQSSNAPITAPIQHSIQPPRNSPITGLENFGLGSWNPTSFSPSTKSFGDFSTSSILGASSLPASLGVAVPSSTGANSNNFGGLNLGNFDYFGLLAGLGGTGSAASSPFSSSFDFSSSIPGASSFNFPGQAGSLPGALSTSLLGKRLGLAAEGTSSPSFSLETADFTSALTSDLSPSLGSSPSILSLLSSLKSTPTDASNN